MKAIILARVSDKKQDSNEAQVNRVSDYVKHKGLNVWKTHEIEESSTQGDREKFQLVVKEIEQSNEPIALVVDTVDRLQRSFKESVQLDDLRKAGKLEIHFYRESLIINQKSNSSDLLRWDMAVMFARSYVLQLSDNVKRKQEQMLRSGQWIGKACYGYKNITKDDGKRDIVIDEFKSKIVLKMYEWYSTGAFSIRLIGKKLRETYEIELSNGYIDKILKDTFYYGEMRSKGILYPHKYETIITKELYDKVQQIKSGYNKKHFKFAGLPYLYRGLLRCIDCGCMITPEKHKGLVYYHCTQYKGKHNAEWLREENITEQFGQLFKKLQLPKEVVEETIESLKNVHQGKSEFREQQVKKLTEEKERYAKRIEGMYLDRLDGRITTDGYDKLYKAFKQKKDDIEAKLINFDKAEDDYYLASEYILRLLQNAYNLFVSSEIEERRQILKLIVQNSVLDGRLVKYSLLKPFDAIVNYADNQSGLLRVDSNHEPFA